GRWHQIRRMCAVHADVPNIHVLIVKNGDIAVHRRQHRKAKLHRKGERRRNRPALVLRIRKALSCNGKLAFLLHYGGGCGRKNRIAIIADQFTGVGLAIRKPAQIPQRLRPRWHSLEIERVLAPPNLHDTRRAVSRKRWQGEHQHREDAEEQSLAFHLLSPSITSYVPHPTTAASVAA